MTGRVLTVGVSLKMYFDPARTVSWAREVAERTSRHDAVRSGGVRLFVLPSLPALPAAVAALAGSGIAVGAQDLFQEDRGAYTGGVSGLDLRAIGCTYVEVGHAERRRVFGEDDAVIRLKLAAAFRSGLTPVLCVGETTGLADEAAARYCVAQLDRLLDGALPDPGAGRPALVVAYEPEWAIGAAEAAPPEHVRTVTAALRDRLEQRPELGPTSVLYGGSAGPGLLSELGDAADGLFLGRFAHDPAALEQVLDETLAIR